MRNALVASVVAGAVLSFSACVATGGIDGEPGPYTKGPRTGGKNPRVDGGGVDPGDDPAPPPPDDDPTPPAPEPATDSGPRPATDTASPVADTAVAKDTAPPPTGDYPAGPYGYSTGATFPNVSFAGYRNGAGAWVTISMADYYDPTGDRHVNALFLDVSASWCSACRAEASGLAAMATKYAPRGGKIMTALIENESSSPATQTTVDNWVSSFDVNYDIVADGKSDSLGSGGVGLPHNYVIDPRTMKIVKIVEGSSGGTTLPGGYETLLTKNGG
jgi:hypothetical protein